MIHSYGGQEKMKATNQETQNINSPGWEGLDAINTGRKLAGDSKPNVSNPGTIRGNLAVDELGRNRNIIHASNNIENANREISFWF